MNARALPQFREQFGTTPEIVEVRPTTHPRGDVEVILDATFERTEELVCTFGAAGWDRVRIESAAEAGAAGDAVVTLRTRPVFD